MRAVARTAAKVALFVGALAAGLGIAAAGAASPVKAQTQIAATNWSGFYVGANGGAIWGLGGNESFLGPRDFAGFDPFTFPGSTQTGGVYGFHAGFNWQFANKWVIGVEGDFDWSKLSVSNFQSGMFSAGVLIPGPTLTMTERLKWLGSARARVGHAWDRTLLYATAGVTWTNQDFGAIQQFVPFPNPNSRNVTNFNVTSKGWVAGAGLEYLVTNNVAIRAEYLFYKINNDQAVSVANQAGVGFNGANFGWDKSSFQVLRVGLSYLFNGPVAARN